MTKTTIINKLQDFKERINEAKNNKARVEGKLEELMSRLKKEFGVDSVETAKRKLIKLEREVDALERELKKGMEELEDEYGVL